MNLTTIVFAELLLFVFSNVQGQKFEETIRKEFPAPAVLYVANVNGNIDVETWDGDLVVIEVNKILRANSQEKLTWVREQLKLGQMNRPDSLIIYIRGVGRCFCKDNEGYGNNENDLYHYRFDDWDSDFDFHFDFTLKVPARTNLILTTINDGDINVSGSEGELLIRNINGNIRLKNISGAAKVSTINGDLDINYISVPLTPSRFYTLNGDINATFNENLNAVLGFKSRNGDLFTNIDNIKYLPVKIEKTEVFDNGGIRYKIGEYTTIKVRNGGVKIDFETFNGNVIVKEI